MNTHVLKCWPQPFADLLSGVKTHEFRLNDRDYQPGDMLKLQCFDPTTERYTGAVLQRQVTHVLRDGFGLPAGYAVLSLSNCLIDELQVAQEFSLNLETLEVMAETAAAAGDIASDAAPVDHPRKPFSIAELTQEQDEFISLVDPASALQLIALARRQLITPSKASKACDLTGAVDGVHWDQFPAYLIDKCEGSTIYEESLQDWLADMLKDPDYLRIAAERASQLALGSSSQSVADELDAERLNWIDEQRSDFTHGVVLGLHFIKGKSGQQFHGKTLRAAIDAARAEEGEES